MLDNSPLPRWAARAVLAAWAWGFVSAVIILVLLVSQRVKEWLKEKGGWN